MTTMTAIPTAGTLAGDWCDTAEAALRLRRSRRAIWRQCVNGRIPSHQLPGGDWLIAAEWVRREQRRMAEILKAVQPIRRRSGDG